MPLESQHLLQLLAAVVAAAAGGALFLRGLLGLAGALRVPNVLVATTLAAFATSSPEMAVSSMAALAGQPGIGLGDALGSNVVNIGLVLGSALLFGPMALRWQGSGPELALALLVPLLTVLLAADGQLSRTDGLALLTVFAMWAATTVRQAIVHRRSAAAAAPPLAQHAHITRWASGVATAQLALMALAGLAALVLAGRLFVNGASGIALALGLPPYALGATVVAMGTSLPEWVTMLLARWRGHDDVGLGTLLGSNLFNGLAVVGLAASIHPIDSPGAGLGVAALFGVLSLLLAMPRQGRLSRGRGLLLLAAWVGFVALTTAMSATSLPAAST